MRLVTPSLAVLDEYRAALETGWSPRTTRPQAAAEELRAIARNPNAFLATLDDPEARRIGLTVVELTADPSNIASVRVIKAKGGCLVERRDIIPAHGEGRELNYRIDLTT